MNTWKAIPRMQGMSLMAPVSWRDAGGMEEKAGGEKHVSLCPL